MKGREINYSTYTESSIYKTAAALAWSVVLSACQVAPVQEPPLQPEPQPEPEPVAECICPEVEPPPPQIITEPCPEPPAPPPPPAPVRPLTSKYIIGRIENVSLPLDDNSSKTLTLETRIDTGVLQTSMHAHDLTRFERDGKDWVRFALLEPETKKPVYFERPVDDYVDIKQVNGASERRPVVSMSLRVGAIEENLEVNLADRSDLNYQVLIGRNFLRDRAVVDVSRRFIADDELHFE